MAGVTDEAQVDSSDNVVVRCEEVWVAYGQDVVLRDVCLDVPGEACMAFLGDNGAGKTTLLRAILGLVPLMRGRITTPFERHAAGYVPQHQTIDPVFPVSARDIIETGLYAARPWWRRQTVDERERIDAALARFDLSDHANKRFDALSGGMRQKVMLARAFVTGADVFVMDEPTSGLDESTEADVLTHLGQLARDGKTVLVAHHGRNRIAPHATHFVQVAHGRVALEEALPS